MLTLNPLLTNHAVYSRELGLTVNGQSDADFVLVNDYRIPVRDQKFSITLHDVTQVVVTDHVTTITLTDLHAGFVGLFAGQSNMEFKLAGELHFEQEREQIPANLYRYTVAENGHPSAWQAVTRHNAGDISAVAYYAAKQFLQNHPDTPFGIVGAYKGGTSASSWVPADVLQEPTLHALYVAPFEAALAGKSALDFTNAEADFAMTSATYHRKRRDYIAAHPELSLAEVKAVVGHTPWPPPMTPTSYRRPNGLFAQMIAPLAPYAFDKVVWYQGEEDTLYALAYVTLLRGLIQSWRDIFQRELPFMIVQLPKYEEVGKDWSTVRLAQARVAQNMPNVQLVSAVDTGEVDNIHPVDKSVLGTRVGRYLLRVDSTPQLHLVRVDETQMIFETVHDLHETHPTHFVVNGQSVVVSIVQNQVVVPLEQPLLSVSYGLGNVPAITLFDRYDEPVSPFLLEF